MAQEIDTHTFQKCNIFTVLFVGKGITIPPPVLMLVCPPEQNLFPVNRKRFPVFQGVIPEPQGTFIPVQDYSIRINNRFNGIKGRVVRGPQADAIDLSTLLQDLTGHARPD